MFSNKRIHMIGIGGISMSGIAQILLDHKAIVSGSDAQESDMTNMLLNLGINVKIGHHPEMIKDSDIVVYTAAIKDDDPEMIEAKRLNKEMYERAEFLGIISKEYENCICISGTHGKSTTTGMLSLVFIESGLNPTVQIGAVLNEINSNTKIGSKKYLIMEACEYVDSFLHFHPTSEIILNIDNDHLDYFKNLDNIKSSFKKYVNLLPSNGILVKNNDDENSNDLNHSNTITYGINNNANYMAKDIKYDELGHPYFDVYYNEKKLIDIHLNIIGNHNVYNSLAVFAMANQYIDDVTKIKKGIEAYHGVKRRFEYLGNYNNAKIYDDYAHHPTEMVTTLESVNKVPHNESWAIFQSHTYSRTIKHLEEFAKVLAKFDHVIIATIYPAREENTYNVKEDMLVSEIKKTNKNVIYIDNFDDIVKYLKENLKENDIAITIGAGTINKVAYDLIKKAQS